MWIIGAYPSTRMPPVEQSYVEETVEGGQSSLS